MKLLLFQNDQCKENHVDIHFREMNDEVKNAIHFFEQKQTIYARDEKDSVQLSLKDIYYMEVIDRKSFVYLRESVMQIEYSLRDFLAFLEGNESFVQIEKAVVVNIDHIERITPDVNMRMNLIMESGDKLVVNRGYKKEFMDCLKKRSNERS